VSEDDELVTVQSFPTPADAELACGMLADAGIKACIFEESVNVWLGGHLPFGALQVKVFEADLERAQKVLASEPWDANVDWSEADRLAGDDGSGDKDVPASPPPTTITKVPADVHPVRFDDRTSDRDYPNRVQSDIDEGVARTGIAATDGAEQSANAFTAQPRQSAPMSAPFNDTSAMPVEEIDEMAKDDSADGMTNRAYRASLLGLFLLMFAPAIHIYSLVLLLMIAFSGKKTSPSLKWKYFTALVIDLLVI
jgi:hypothetical protein